MEFLTVEHYEFLLLRFYTNDNHLTGFLNINSRLENYKQLSRYKIYFICTTNKLVLFNENNKYCTLKKF